MYTKPAGYSSSEEREARCGLGDGAWDRHYIAFDDQSNREQQLIDIEETQLTHDNCDRDSLETSYLLFWQERPGRM